MSRHSKNANTRQFFTYEERRRLMSEGGSLYGSKRVRLGADSMLPFDACRLCMKPAQRPVVTATLGHLYCKECILENILEQRRRIERMKQRAQERKERKERLELERKLRKEQEAVQKFEQWESGAVVTSGSGDPSGEGGAVSSDRVGYGQLKAEYRSPVFWAPEATPSAQEAGTSDGRRHHHHQVASLENNGGDHGGDDDDDDDTELQLRVVDPMDPAEKDKDKKTLRVKDLVELRFVRNEKGSKQQKDDGDAVDHLYHRYQCPVCVRTLNNAVKGVAMRRCGHVICLPCSDKFLVERSKAKSKTKPPSSSSSSTGEKLACPVCSERIRKPARDMIWLRTAGTGFATQDHIPEVRKKSNVAVTSFI